MSVGAVQPDDELIPPAAAEGGVSDSARVDQLLGTPAPADAPLDLIQPEPTPPAPGAALTPAQEKLVGPADVGPPAPQPVTDNILAGLPPGPATGPPAPGSVPVGPSGEGEGAPVTPEGVIAKEKDLAKQKAEDDLLAAQDAQKAALEFQKAQHDATDHGNAQLDRARAMHDEALAKYQAMAPHQLQPSITAMIGVAFGGLGAALSAAGGGSAENRVLTQWNKRVDDDYKNQLANIDKARASVLMAQTGIDDAAEAKRAAVEDVTAKWTATKAAAENEARLHLAERGVPAADIDSDKRILQLQADRQKAAIAAEDRRKKEAMDAARIKLLEAEAKNAEANAAWTAGGRGKKAKGGGGGGGIGKPGAIAEFKGAIVDGTDDGKGGMRPLDAREIQKVADRLGIPATAKAGRPSVENLTKDVAFVAGQKDKSEAGVQKRNDKIDADLQKELYPAGGRGPGTQLERITAMRGELKDAIASGDKTAATRVLEEAGGMLSGGKSTKNTVHLLEELKSNSDKMSSLWGRITSNPGDTKEYTQRLDKLLEGAGAEKKSEIDAITKRYDEKRTKGGGATGPIATARAALAASAAPVPQGKRLRLKDGRTGTLDADGLFHQDQ